VRHLPITGLKKHVTWTDKVVGLFSPARALRRAAVRAYLDGYDVTRPGRTRRTYRGGGGGADEHLDRRTLWQLRELCRKHDRDSALMGGLLDTMAGQIVGDALQFVPSTDDADWNRRASDYILSRMDPEAFDYRGEVDYRQGLRLCLRALWTDGDILQVPLTDGRVQTWEAHELGSPWVSRRITNGIERSDEGPTVAYHVVRKGRRSTRGYVHSTDDLKRIDARGCYFLANRYRYNQTRGVPHLARCLEVYDRLDNYIDSETIAAELGAKLGFQITRNPERIEALPGQSEQTDPGRSGNSVTTFDFLQRMEPGMILDLEMGEEVKNIGGWRPNQTFEAYMLAVCRLMAVATGIPLEMFLLDFTKTNWHSTKASFSIAHRNFKVWQRTLELFHCRRWYRWQIARAIASGDLDVPATPDPYKHRIQWPAWPWLDLEKEMKGQILACLGLSSKSVSEVIRERGGEPAEVFDEIARERQTMEEMNILPPDLAQLMASLITGTTQTDDGGDT
jgi:lambda family phage portal protein